MRLGRPYGWATSRTRRRVNRPRVGYILSTAQRY
jgi:hypothetical protein